MGPHLTAVKARPRWVIYIYQLFLGLTVVGAFSWLDLLVHMVLAAVTLFNTVSGANFLISGLTVVAVGNSCPDYFITSALAKKGYLVMASTGILAGVLLNFLLGFGLSNILKTIR